MHVRLTSAQLQGIFTTGSATSARSATIEGTTEELTSRAEAALTKLPRARVGRTADGMVLADRSSALVIEEWVVQVSRFGPKATVSLRGSRAIRAWVVVAVWFGLSTAFGVGAAALLFVFMPRPPEFLPGVVFVAGLIATIVGAQTFARTQANRWALATHKSLGGVAGIMEGKSAAAAYR